MTYKPLLDSLTIQKSKIDGLGLFAIKDIKKDTNLGVSHISLEDEIIRTPLGGFINHQDIPNCKRVVKYNKSYIYTIKDIKRGEDITLRYEMYSV